MNHERRFNHLSNQFLEHLSNTEDELGFRLDKNMMHIPGSQRPLVYSGLTMEFGNDNTIHRGDPHNSSDSFEIAGDLPREQGPSSSFRTYRESSVNRPSNTIERSIVSGFIHPSPKGLGLDLDPEEVLFQSIGGRDLGDDEEIRSMKEAQRRMVDHPELASWQDLHPDARRNEQRLEVERFRNHSGVKAVITPSEAVTGNERFWYSSDFDPASRQFDNPKIMKRWDDPGIPL